jgi:DHA2 family multidrug resistance protein
VLPVSGWISSLLGRKLYFVLCIASFAATSLLCGLAPNLAVLTLFRAAQGIAGGGLQPMAQTILADAFPPQKRGLAFAVYGVAAVFAPAIGPALGGWITDSFTWRWVFLLNVPVGIILTVVAWRALPNDRPARRRGIDFDYLGFALLIVGMGALQLVLDRGQEDDWFSSSLITTLAITAVIGLAGFMLWELRRADPIVDLALLKHRNFAVGNLLLFVLGFTLMGSTVLVPLFVQSLLGYTATDAGLVLSPGGFAIMLLMPITGALSGKIDNRVFIAIGLVAGALALFHMTGFDATTDYSTIVFARIYQSISLAFLFIPMNTAATVGLPMHKSDKIFAITNMTRNIGGSFGISVVTTILARRQQYHQSVLVEHVSPLNHAYNAMLQAIQHGLAAHAASAAQALGLAQARLAGMVTKQALALSFIDVFWFMGVAFLAATPLVFLLRGGKAQGGAPMH